MDATNALDLILLIASLGLFFCAGMFLFELATSWKLPTSTLGLHDFNIHRQASLLPTDHKIAA